MPPLAAFAVAAPGLAPLVADELRGLGIAPTEVDEAGAAFDATPEQLWRANLWLRTASRVVVRLATFEARTFSELERRARRVPWETVVAPGRAVRLRVTCRKSRLYHSDAVAERVADAVLRSVPGVVDVTSVRGADDDVESEGGEDAQLLVVRFLHDRCTISADASGALLHRRGYREAVAQAPLRETLAAALLLASGWDGRAPLVDPLCGSGTIAIEGALLARRVAPGRRRSFAFERWPGFDPARWEAVLAEADEGALPTAPGPIAASDRLAGAVRAARANAERAGVTADVAFDVRAFESLQPPNAPGWIVTNPPYGKRVGDDAREVRSLWAKLGATLRARCPGWHVALLTPDARLASAAALPLRSVLATRNGGLAVQLNVGRIVAVAGAGRGARSASPAIHEPGGRGDG